MADSSPETLANKVSMGRFAEEQVLLPRVLLCLPIANFAYAIAVTVFALFGPGHWAMPVAAWSLLPAFLLSIRFARQGRRRVAGALVAVAFFGAVLAMHLLLGNTHSLVLGYAIAVLVAGLTVGLQPAIALVILAAGASLTIGVLEARGVLVPAHDPAHLLPMTLFTMLAGLGTILALVRLSRREVLQVVARERSLSEELRGSREELERHVAEVESAEQRARTEASCLVALQRSANNLIALTDLDDLLAEIVEGAMEMLHASAGGVYLYDDERDVMVWSIGRGQEVAPVGTVLQRGEGVSGQLIDNPRTIIIEDYAEFTGRKSTAWPNPHTSLLIVPIQWHGNLLGAINLRRDPVDRAPFGPDEASLLEQLATHAAAAIENAALYRRASEELLERRTAEFTLRSNERKYRTLLDNLGEGVCVLGLDLGFRLANPAAAELFCTTPAALAGKQLTEFLRPEDRERLATPEELLAGAARLPLRVEICRPDGGRHVLGITATPQHEPGGRLESILLLLRDDTERERLETQLRQAQKMEAVGTLTGGIAHDFNNILTAVSGYAEMALLDCEEGTALHEAVRGILDASRRGGRFTRQLLAFSRSQIVQPELLDCSVLVQDVEKLLGRLIGEDITFELDLADDLPPVMADPGQMEQILINLIVNARDALENVDLAVEAKRIGLATTSLELSAQDIDRADGDPGPYIRIEVRDNGSGMAPEIVEKIFDPFFTTKDVGRGTGLGLATVYGLVHQNRGRIRVSSEPGVGTTFQIDLPETRVGSAEAVCAGPGKTAASGGETILLVEDEEQIREFASRTLEKLGYRVHVVAGGAEALDLLRDGERSVDLVLTDVVMPKMSGLELAVEIRRLRPSMPIVYTSGYPGTPAGEFTLPPDEPFLPKPYDTAELDAIIRDVLDRIDVPVPQ